MNEEELSVELRDYFAAKAMQGILAEWNYEAELHSVFKPSQDADYVKGLEDTMKAIKLHTKDMVSVDMIKEALANKPVGVK